MSEPPDVFSRLKERQQARLLALEQKKAEKKENSRIEESADYFTQQLQSRKSAIACLLDQSSKLSKNDLPSHFEKVSAEYRELQKFVSDSAVFLTSYDFKTAQKQVTELQQQISAKQDQLLPKKKFAFSSRKKEAASKPIEEGGVKVQTEKAKVMSSAEHPADTSSKEIRDKTGLKLVVESDEVRGRDVHLTGLEECEVKVFGAPSTLHVTNTRKCSILSGPVSGSVFLDGCSDCVFVVACQQLRVHSTSSSQFYLHVTSRAIIEDCRQLTFAPFSWTYPDLTSHFQEAGLDQGVNNWDQVDDFNWLASQEPSPNWTLLPKDKRIPFSS